MARTPSIGGIVTHTGYGPLSDCGKTYPKHMVSRLEFKQLDEIYKCKKCEAKRLSKIKN